MDNRKKKSTAKNLKGRKTSNGSKKVGGNVNQNAPAKKPRVIERVGAGIKNVGRRVVKLLNLNSKLKAVSYTAEQLANKAWKDANGFMSKRIESLNVVIMTLAKERDELFDWIAANNADGLVINWKCGGFDARGLDLEGFKFERCTILAGRFDGANLSGVKFVDCVLSGTVFSKALGLESCEFLRCRMIHTTFVDVSLGIVKNCVLNRSYIQVANLSNTDFEGCTLDRVKFEAIVDEKANFSKAKSMRLAKFDGYSEDVYKLFSIARSNELNLTHTKAKLRRTGRSVKSEYDIMDELLGNKARRDAGVIELAKAMLSRPKKDGDKS